MATPQNVTTFQFEIIFVPKKNQKKNDVFLKRKYFYFECETKKRKKKNNLEALLHLEVVFKEDLMSPKSHLT